jgi:profilin
VAGFKDPSGLTSGGIYLGGVKYLAISTLPEVIRGKKGQEGVTISKTNSALVIGIYGEGVQPADGNLLVEKLADYLINQGI